MKRNSDGDIHNQVERSRITNEGENLEKYLPDIQGLMLGIKDDCLYMFSINFLNWVYWSLLHG